MKNLRTFLLALAAALAVTALIGLGALKTIDRQAQDTLFQRPRVPSTDIVIIGIDDETLTELGPFGPNYRMFIAYALQQLASDPERRPAAVAVDVLYEGLSGTAADEQLAAAAEKLGCVITASVAEYGEEIVWQDGHAVSRNTASVVRYAEPYEALKNVTTQGHINAMLDTDGILRHALLYVEPEEGRRVYSMAFQTAGLYLRRQGREPRLPPVNAAGHFYVPFTGQPGSFYDGASVSDLLYGALPSSYWDGKIVLIGPYASSLQDTYFSSVNRASPMYGVEFQANVIQCLLDENFKTEVPDLPQLIALFVLCAAAALFFFRLKVGQGGLLCAGLVLLGPGGSLLLYLAGFVTHPLWLAAAAPVLYAASLAAHYVRAARERQALALKEERLNAELDLATRIQANALPRVFPAFPDRREFDVFASMTPAKEVGGDLYDFFLMDEDHLCLVIGDVSGKGVPAALFMMMTLTLIHHVAMRDPSPGSILRAVNQEICTRNPEEMFVTVWLGVLEISTGRLTCANAGHEYPVLKKADGHFELFKDRHGVVIGGMEGVRYREYALQLDPGDKLFVYTDGVAEAANAQEVFFGTDRLVQALRSLEDGTPKELLEAVAQSVQAFVGGAPQFDDLTMLCLSYSGPETDPAAPACAEPSPTS